jgi:ABC-type phosphate/phosphonate transport system ATPase subunit
MIELLGLAMPAEQGGWLFRRLSARAETAELIAVVSEEPRARLALLDVVAARHVPPEGRVWLNGQPLTRETQRRFRSRVVEVDLDAPLAEDRSLRSNVQRGGGRGGMLGSWRGRFRTRSAVAAHAALSRVGLERFAGEQVGALGPWVRRRALIARAVASQPDILVVREIERGCSAAEAADVLCALSVLVACDRLTVFVSTGDPTLVQTFAQRVLDIADGALRFNGPPSSAMTAASPPPLVATA